MDPKFFLSALFFVFSIFVSQPTLASSTQEKKFISFNNIQELLKIGKYVDGFKINSDDLITIIKSNTYHIKIKNCIIVGDLDFSRLPGVLFNDDLITKLNLNEDAEYYKERTCPPFIYGEICDQKFEEQRNKQRSESPIISRSYDLERGSCRVKLININILIENSVFDSHVRAKQVFFLKDLIFAGSEFKIGADFSHNLFFGFVTFMQSTFGGEADFSFSYFSQGGFGTFLQTKFNSVAKFYSTHFENISFIRTEFADRVNFIKAHFGKELELSPVFSEVSFDRVKFFDEVTFDCAAFFGTTTFFLDCEFRKEASFINVLFNSAFIFARNILFAKIAFSDSQWLKTVNFDDSVFKDKTEFKNCSFLNSVFIDNIRFENNVNFLNSKFHDILIIQNTDIEKRADFRNCRINTIKLRGDTEPHTINGVIDFSGACIFSGVVQNVSVKKISFHLTTFGHPETIDNCLLLKVDNNCVNYVSSFSFINRLKTQDSKINSLIYINMPEKLKPVIKAPQKLTTNLLKDVSGSDLEICENLEIGINNLIKSENLSQTVIYEKQEDSVNNLIQNYMVLRDAYPIEMFSLLPNPTLMIFNTKFIEDVTFQSSQFYGGLIIHNSDFNKKLDFSSANLRNKEFWPSKYFGLSFVRTNNLIVDWRLFPEIETWINHKDFFSKGSENQIENEHRLLKRLESQITKNASPEDLKKFHKDLAKSRYIERKANASGIKKIYLKFESYIFWLLSDYRTDIIRICISFFVLMIICGILYFFFSTIEDCGIKKDNKHAGLTGLFFPNYFLSPKESNIVISKPIKKLIECMKISFSITFKIRITNTRFCSSNSMIIKPIMYLQSIFSFGIFILLFFTIKNTSPLWVEILNDIK